MRKRLGRIGWIIWAILITGFTIKTNSDASGIKNNISADIFVGLVLFTWLPWIIRQKIKLGKAKRAARQKGDFENPILARNRKKSALNFIVALSIFSLSVVVINAETDKIALLDDQVLVQDKVITPTSPAKNTKVKAKSPGKTSTPLDTKYIQGDTGENLSFSLVGNKSGAPLVWKSCAPIKVYINPGTIDSAVEDTKKVLEYFNSFTHLNFVYSGSSAATPGSEFLAGKPGNVVLVAFVNPDAIADVEWNKMYAKDQTLGLGSYSTDGLDFYRGELSIKESYSSLKENQKFGVIAHELGHVIGLGHVAAQNDIMYPENSQDVVSTFNEEVTAYFNEHPGCSNG
jgi:hypothetical protein